MLDYYALLATLAPPGTVLAAGAWLAKRSLAQEGVLVAQKVVLTAQADRLVRIETQVDKLVDHLIDKA